MRAGRRPSSRPSGTALSGIGGFFEKTFAPKGLGRIYDELLQNLATEVEK